MKIKHKNEKENLRAIRKEIEEQQKLLKQYEQICYRSMVLKVMPKVPVIKMLLQPIVGDNLLHWSNYLKCIYHKGFTDVQAAGTLELAFLEPFNWTRNI